MDVYYVVFEDGDEELHPNVFSIPGKKRGEVITVGDIRNHFPLPGDYIFRFKIEFKNTYVWLDAPDDYDDPAPQDANGVVFVKASRIHAPTSTNASGYAAAATVTQNSSTTKASSNNSNIRRADSRNASAPTSLSDSRSNNGAGDRINSSSPVSYELSSSSTNNEGLLGFDSMEITPSVSTSPVFGLETDLLGLAHHTPISGINPSAGSNHSNNNGGIAPPPPPPDLLGLSVAPFPVNSSNIVRSSSPMMPDWAPPPTIPMVAPPLRSNSAGPTIPISSIGNNNRPLMSQQQQQTQLPQKKLSTDLGKAAAANFKL